ERCVRLDVRRLEEEPAHLRREEDHGREQHEEDAETEQVLDRVVRMKRYSIQRMTVRSLRFLDLDAVRVVRADLVQREDVRDDKEDQDKRQRDHMQREEAVQRDVRDEV